MKKRSKKPTRRPKHGRDLDPVLVVHGYFFPSLQGIGNLHKSLSLHMMDFGDTDCQANISGVNEGLPHEVTVRSEDNFEPMRLSAWIDQVEDMQQRFNANHLSLYSPGKFCIGCNKFSTSNMRCQSPANASLLLYDVSQALGTENYSLFDIARNIVLAIEHVGNCGHALIDYDFLAGYHNYGSIYGAFTCSPMRWNMWLDFVDWGTLGLEEQARRIRRLCWGNYFGPAMAERLGPTFIEEYLGLKYDYEGSPQTAERLSGGGIYVTLTNRPQDILECEDIPDVYELPVVRNAAWLRQRLRRLNMI